ncbi:uncharacterized protein A4U43_C05F15910 [Asparagus officinalis]|uniref:NAD-dependent epimerase/dehydratase domain-containing protein n=1 Tax=Asparagus officinalis TaxID=4686 RepID=A0A5P1EVT8_ASPOF|nr:uncharacterized protein A4U43_C05F15910 [Asparagus officinalis]
MGDYKKVAHLWELEGASERLQLVKADLMEMGSFDDAVMGCEGVFHTASPVCEVKSNPDAVMGCEGVFHTASPVCEVKSNPKAEIVDPAVNGTLNVLLSCEKNPALRRVVLTSSSCAVRTRDDIDPAVPLDESSWGSVELCERLGIWYALGKILAEKAAWEFAEAHNINLVTVLPSFVVGPMLPHDLCLTVSDVLDLLKGNSEKFSWHGRMGYVHIDDVARCHILVYEDSTAHGRYLCSSTVLDTHELAALLAQRYPSLPVSTRFKDHYEMPAYAFDTSKLQKMGFQFIGVEEMFDDCVEFLKRRGYINF